MSSTLRAQKPEEKESSYGCLVIFFLNKIKSTAVIIVLEV